MVRVFDSPITTNDQSIDRVLSAGLPVLLIFFTGQPGLALDQTLNELAKEHAGQLLVVKVTVKDSPGAVQRYHINRTPALVAVRNGEVVSSAENASANDLSKTPPFSPAAARNQPANHQPPSSRRVLMKTAGPGSPQMPPLNADVLQSSLPVLVDFWAPWCGPCRMVEPVMEKWAREYHGRFNIVKMNVDENPHTSARYRVQSIPTMLVVKNGQIVDRWAGALPENALRNRVAAQLGI